MKLLDTTFLIHYWAGSDEVKEYLETNDEAEFATTTINIKEVAVGRALQDQLNPYDLQSTFQWLTIIPFQVTHAFVAAELEAKLHRNENINQDKINAVAGDVLIAAVAKQIDATVVTQNSNDFELFEDVSIETY
ncbi:MAG: type II toxin-antitoxin system VapC family toxin [Halobacteriaceae archaeon]